MATDLDSVATFQTLQEAGVIPIPPRELDEDDMEHLHQGRVAFTVHRVSEEPNEQYGMRYTLYCERPNHPPFLLRFWSNPVRDPIVLALMGITKKQPVTDVYLGSQKRGKMSLYIPAGTAD